MSAREKLVRVDDDTYTYASHTSAFSRPPGKKSAWLVTVSGPTVNSSLEMSGQRDALARQAASGISIARSMGSSGVKYGRLLR